MMVCANCRTPSSGGLFCAKCGGQLVNQAQQQGGFPQQPQQQQGFPPQQQGFPPQQQGYPPQQQGYPPQQQQQYGAPPPQQGFPPQQQQTGYVAPNTTGVDYEFLYRGSFTMLKVRLKPGEMIKAESGAMVAMSSTVDVEGKMEGGLFGGLGRMLSGEKFFFQTLAARRGPGEILLSPAALGDLGFIQMEGIPYIVQKDGFFAASNEVAISTTMQNLTKGLFSGEGFFVIKASGRGALFVSSYGAVHPIDLLPGQDFIIDNAHLVAWPENVNYRIEKASSGWFSSITSGEGLVCRFTGPGRVFIQSRNPQSFGQWIKQFLPPPPSHH